MSDTCTVCKLDYSFASPDDGPAFFSLCFAAFPLMFLVVWIHVTFEKRPSAGRRTKRGTEKK